MIDEERWRQIRLNVSLVALCLFSFALLAYVIMITDQLVPHTVGGKSRAVQTTTSALKTYPATTVPLTTAVEVTTLSVPESLTVTLTTTRVEGSASATTTPQSTSPSSVTSTVNGSTSNGASTSATSVPQTGTTTPPTSATTTSSAEGGMP